MVVKLTADLPDLDIDVDDIWLNNIFQSSQVKKFSSSVKISYSVSKVQVYRIV